MQCAGEKVKAPWAEPNQAYLRGFFFFQKDTTADKGAIPSPGVFLLSPFTPNPTIKKEFAIYM